MESQTKDAIISDSGYSHSGSNRTSQGSGSSKSKHTNGTHSSGSGSYDEAPKPNTSSERCTHSDHNRDIQQENIGGMSMPRLPKTFTLSAAKVDAIPSTSSAMDIEVAPSDGSLEKVTPEVGDFENKNNELLLTISDPQNGTKIVEENVPEIWHEKDSIEVQAGGECAVSKFASHQLAAESGGFCCLISMVDGLVLYTTPNVTSVLGFPKEMWLGHSFIDFVHPKDRETFSNQVSANITLFLVDAQEKIKEIKEHVFVYLRRHLNGTPLGKPISYQAFDLTITIKQMPDHPNTGVIDPNKGIFLFIFAVPVRTVYKVPGERKISPKFGMRHTATCIFTYVDPDVVANFGFLPQDMLGKSVFDFYHPEDMPFLKDVYTSVLKTCQVSGSMFRSKPYRFLVQNGDFALIETEWSGVTNPWSRRLEFVISLHQVLQGPLNPDVFDVPCDGEYRKIPQDVIEQGRMLQTEIIQLLTDEIPKPATTSRQDGFNGCKDLATFMDINKMTKLVVDLTPEFHHVISERDSVTLGEISPHHDLCDSKSSSETPPSYNQLNYNENISRFFQSNPKTTVTSDESTSNAMDTNGKSSEDCVPDQKGLWPIQNSEASGYDSTGNMSSHELQSRTNVPIDARNSSLLTESILVRHNEDMESIMLQKHKKERYHIKDRQGKKNYQKLEKNTNDRLRECTIEESNQGVKRTVSDSWGNHDCRKMSKYEDFRVPENGNIQGPTPISAPAQKVEHAFPRRNPGLWSSFPATIPSNVQTDVPAAQQPGNMASNAGMSPLYYVPTFVQPRPVNNNNIESSQKYPMHYTPTFVLWSYNPVFLPQPMLLPNVPVIPMQSSSSSMNTMVANPEFLNPATRRQSTTIDNAFTNQHRINTNLSTFQCDRPASQATSIKVEPGSMRDSIASASVVNKELSERSRKDFGLLSVCSPDTPLVSPPYGEIQLEQFNIAEVENSQKQSETNYRTKKMVEESSWYSSSYSSLLKTESASGSNDSSLNNSANNIRKQQQSAQSLRTKDPPWLQSVSISSDLIYKYQMSVRSLEDVLKSDLDILKKTEQPMMVNDQLRQLYIEMDLNGLESALSLDYSSSSSNSSSSRGSKINPILLASQKQTRKKSYNSLMMMMCEEGAPLPSPESNS